MSTIDTFLLKCNNIVILIKNKNLPSKILENFIKTHIDIIYEHKKQNNYKTLDKLVSSLDKKSTKSLKYLLALLEFGIDFRTNKNILESYKKTLAKQDLYITQCIIKQILKHVNNISLEEVTEQDELETIKIIKELHELSKINNNILNLEE